MFSAFSFVYDDLYDEIPGIRSVASPGRQSEAAAPGENRSVFLHAHTQIAHRSRNLAMPQCLRDHSERHIFRPEKIRGEGSTDRMRRDQIARFRAAHPPGPFPHTPMWPISCRFMPFHPAFNRFVFLSGIVFLRPKPKPRIFRTSRDENTYAFAYDSFARLTDTRHYEAGALTDRFAEKGLTYDANGNLRTLMRTGNGLTLNDLEYSYTGNRIASIADAGAVYDYGYDANGNMTHDGANDLDITYNCLNMTQKVEKKGTLSANYSYLADSTKLSATEPGGDGLYYSGSLVYGKRDGKLSLESAGFNGGRFVVTSNGIQTHLFVTDHLGSVRAVVDPASGEATETDDYYPFGLRWEDAEALISDNRYRYNGKEEQVFVGIPYVDFGFRMMDPEFRIGWNTADPKSEKYSGSSPYIYCGNDPIGNIDPDGSVYDKYYNSLGYLMYDTGKGDKTYVIRAAGYERDFRVNSISEQAAIDTENAIRQGNLSGPHMQNIMEIESVPTLKKMRNTIKDDGTGGDSDNNNREYGGIVNHEGQIANVSQGEVRESGKHASVSINPKGARSVYHSHPSGSKNLGPLKGSSRFPSRQDHKSIGTATGYLFQMRTKEIIVFDNKKIEAIVSFSILEDLYK